MEDWDSLRYFLAVARAGSSAGAAEKLRVDQSTVSRNIAAFERAVRAKLFERSVSGYELTDLGRKLVPAAERAELEISGIIGLVGQNARRSAGIIKVATNETIADLFLMPSLAEFAELYPEIRIDVSVSSQCSDLSKGEADVAIRAAKALKDDDVVASRLSDFPWAIYGSQDYFSKHGFSNSAAELPKHKIISVEGGLGAVTAFQWLEEQAGYEAVVSRTNSLPNVVAAVRAGLGVSALPMVTGQAEPGLVHCLGPSEELNSSLWLLIRSQIKDDPTIRAFSSFVLSKVPLLRRLMTGSYHPY